MASRRLAVLVAGAVLGGALWWRRNPSACPYSQRFWVEAPHPIITRSRLRSVLRPRLGERTLELGIGTGYYSFDLAEWVGGAGTIELCDLQPEMLDHVMERAREREVSNLVPTQADAVALPYEDDSMDAVVLTTVLGEIPAREAAMREIARVLRPGGRLVVGELLGDPHFQTPATVERLGTDAGLFLEERSGPWAASFTRLGKPA